jgi:hypothetical protein
MDTTAKQPAMYDPAWAFQAPRSPRELVESVAEEGAERLLFTPTSAQRKAIDDQVYKALGFSAGDHAMTYLDFFAREALTLGIKLGMALAQLNGRLDLTAGDFELWLKQVIETAGLEEYRPGPHLQ